ncbi:MAG: hypothetical protein BGP21_03055 [Thiobacillus sp. 65-29]|jgi:hypothetical protein|nr:MAG: hypothetical protein BGP21_03055 [Thiobacillus sp. 65-29]
MKTHEFHTLRLGLLGATLAAAVSGGAFAMDPDEAQLIRHGWQPQAEVAYTGTDGELGFDDPRPGSSSHAAPAYQGTSMRADAENADTLGFTDPRPGDSSY